MSERKSVLVVAAHPDDEILGCGGTICRHSEAGDDVNILILAEGATSRDEHRDPDRHKSYMSGLQDAANCAAEILGARRPVFGGLPDNRLDSIDLLDVTKLIEREIARIDPHIVYTHHSSDLNLDHWVTHRATLTACRPIHGTRLRTLRTFEVLSSTEWAAPGAATTFAPMFFVDVTTVLDRKLRALEAYGAEMRPFPHPRSYEAVRALAAWRGASSGVAAAEAFQLIRGHW